MYCTVLGTDSAFRRQFRRRDSETTSLKGAQRVALWMQFMVLKVEVRQSSSGEHKQALGSNRTVELASRTRCCRQHLLSLWDNLFQHHCLCMGKQPFPFPQCLQEPDRHNGIYLLT